MTIAKIVSDEVLGHVARRQNELFRRIREGTIPAYWAIDRLQEIIERRAEPLSTPSVQVEVGAYSNAQLLISALKEAGHYVGGAAEALMRTAEFEKSLSGQRRKFKIFFRRPADFFFEEKVPRQRFFNAALSSGVELCSPEMGPLVRLAYRHEIESEDVYIGMRPLSAINGGEPLIFHVTNNTGQGSKLNVLHGGLSNFANPQEVWTFCQPI